MKKNIQNIVMPLFMVFSIFSLAMFLNACSEGSGATAPADFSVTVPADQTWSISQGTSLIIYGSRVAVTDTSGNPVNDVKVTITFAGDSGAFSSFCNDSDCLSPIAGTSYTDKTNDFGFVEVNYQSIAFACQTTNTYEIGYSAASGIHLEGHKDTINVTGC